MLGAVTVLAVAVLQQQGQQRLDLVAAVVRYDVMAGSGSTGLLAAYDLAAASSSGPDPELVAGAGAVDAISSQAAYLDNLATAAATRLPADGPTGAARWARSGSPVTSAVPSAPSVSEGHRDGRLLRCVAGQLLEARMDEIEGADEIRDVATVWRVTRAVREAAADVAVKPLDLDAARGRSSSQNCAAAVEDRPPAAGRA